MQQMGNSRARAVYEANLPDNFRRPQTDVALENFIRAKYEHKKYIAQEWVKPPPPRVDWNAEIEEQIRRKKEKKTADVSTAVLPPKLGAAAKLGIVKSSSNNTKPSHPPPIGKIDVGKQKQEVQVSSATPPQQPTSASDDLLGLTTDTPPNVSASTSDPFASPVKSTNASGGAPTSSADDLGGVFTAVDQNSQQKMTKESILSLYGNLGGGTGNTSSGFGGGGGGGMIPPVSSNNPFTSTAGQFGGASMTNPFPTQAQGMFSNDLIGNNGFGAGGANLMMGGPPTSNLSQVDSLHLHTF